MTLPMQNTLRFRNRTHGVPSKLTTLTTLHNIYTLRVYILQTISHYASHLVLSYLVLSHLVSSYPIWCHHVLSQL
jgi:hypothetical protein